MRVATVAGETSETTTFFLTLTPKYEKCEFAKLGKNSATVNMNGCDYLITVEFGEVDIICPEGKRIVITVSITGVKKCTIELPGQPFLHTIKYDNNADGSVTVTPEVERITYVTHAGTGPGACAATSDGTDGTYTGAVRVTGAINGVNERIWVE